MPTKHPDGSVTALCSAATALFALLVAFLGYTSFKSTGPWTWLDLFLQIIPAILAGASLVSVPIFATREREVDAVAESVRVARRPFLLGACLVAFVIFVWLIRDFIGHHE
ncbi:MAG: hypothetical protein JWM68_650 [Verrucomicrobiales bacterium]|nr:hypothetical protein [Verrucomicrobiales bacterium]